MENNTNKYFDALVIGGGIIGILTARHLQSKGYKLAVIDKGRLGGESSWAAGGILAPLKPWQITPEAESLIDEGRQNFEKLVDDLKQETGIDPELVRSGMLVIEDLEQKLDATHPAITWAERKDEPVEVLNHKDLCRNEPAISKNFAQALLLPNIEQIRPPSLIASVRHSMQIRNIRVFESTPVINIIIEHDKVSGVATRSGNFYAEKIIICSGAWTKSLLQNMDSVDIEPVRGQMLLYKTPTKLISNIVLKDKTYVIPRNDGHLLCGSTVERVGFNNDITEQANRYLQASAQSLVPLLKEHEPVKQWSALRPGTQRDKPYICKHPTIDGLFLNSGHYRYGIIMSIASARLMTDLVTNTSSSSHITGFGY